MLHIFPKGGKISKFCPLWNINFSSRSALLTAQLLCSCSVLLFLWPMQRSFLPLLLREITVDLCLIQQLITSKMRLYKHSQWHHEAFMCLNNELNSSARAVSTPHHLLSWDCIKSLQILYVKTFTICQDFAPQLILFNFSVTEIFAACLKV